MEQSKPISPAFHTFADLAHASLSNVGYIASLSKHAFNPKTT